jgi:hypothetical protein
MKDAAMSKQQVSSPDSEVIDQLRQELEEARDEAELNLLQLQQVQEELEQYQLRQGLEEAPDDAEVNLLQLQKLKEELEQYSIDHQRQQQELALYAQEAMRAERLIAALLEMLEGRG